MKIKRLYWYLLLCVGCSNASHYNFSIVGNIDDVRNGQVLLMSEYHDDTVCSARLKNGKFELSGDLSEPGRYVLKVNRRSFSFFMDGEEMRIDCPYDSLSPKQLVGSLANDISQEYNQLLDRYYGSPQTHLLKEYVESMNKGDLKKSDAIMTKVLKLDEARFRLTRDFIRKYPDNIFSAYVADVAKKDSYEWGVELYDLLSERIQYSQYGKKLKEHVDLLSKSAIGRACPDVRFTSQEGEDVSLYSLKGTPVVLDFWASWCGPCRQEMQSLKELYKEFQNENVRFVSISLDDDQEEWLKACEEEQIPWLSLWGKGWKDSEIRQLLGIESIPCIILLDKQGNIVAKNVRRNILREEFLKLLDMELKPTQQTIALLNKFFDYTRGKTDVTDRATWVLYNLENESVREAYVLWALEQKLSNGENYNLENVLDDITLTSSDNQLYRKAEALAESYARLQTGEKAINFTLENLDGGKVELNDFLGKMIYICVLEASKDKAENELAALKKFREQQGDRFEFLVVAVGDQENKNAWKRFIHDKGYDRIFVNTYVMQTDVFLKDYRVSKLPRFVLIGESGQFIAPWFFSPMLEEQLHFILNYMLRND